MPLLYGGGFDPLASKRKRGVGRGGYDDLFKDYNMAAPQTSLEDLTKKYLAGVPKVDIPSDPEAIYGGLVEPARRDVTQATEKIGLGLQKHAAGGSSYEDLLARYLPGAIEPLADVASKASAQAQEFGQRGAVASAQQEQARFNAAKDMALAERGMQEEGRRFMLDLKARIQMAEREIRAKERIALQGARSAEHAARISANARREVARIAANAQMETTRFAQTQENYRNNVRMQVYDKWYGGLLKQGERRDIMTGTELASRLGPGTPATRYAPRTGGVTDQQRRDLNFESQRRYFGLT
jgi:hypothetical protein